MVRIVVLPVQERGRGLWHELTPEPVPIARLWDGKTYFRMVAEEIKREYGLPWYPELAGILKVYPPNLSDEQEILVVYRMLIRDGMEPTCTAHRLACEHPAMTEFHPDVFFWIALMLEARMECYMQLFCRTPGMPQMFNYDVEPSLTRYLAGSF